MTQDVREAGKSVMATSRSGEGNMGTRGHDASYLFVPV